MNKWIAEFDLEDGDIMPEHMELNFKGAKIDFYCRPKEPIHDKIRAEIEGLTYYWCEINPKNVIDDVLEIIDKYKSESEK